jgi:ABC-type multidrug transport system fused ATPase/permease subunit
MRAAYKRDFQAWFEPGKFLVSECGYLVTQVNVMKQSAGTMFAGVNSGFNHLIRPMFYEAYHRIENISNPGAEKKHYTVTGNICETDTFAWDRELNEVREGDLLLFYNAGAYGYEMGSNYNARYRPAQVLVIDGKAHLREKGYYGGFVKKPAGSALNPGTGLSCNRMIEIRNIQKKFGERVILHDITAVMEAGKCNLIIGTSGSGKTVLTKCMVGLFEPDNGSNPVRWCGYDHHGRRPPENASPADRDAFPGNGFVRFDDG